jgi:biopolymer transport protein ExbD
MGKASRKAPEINAGSMADIAFLLLIFFLVTTTMDVDSGLVRRLPPPPEDVPADSDIKNRNIMVVLINANDQLLVRGEPMNISELRKFTKEFIANPADRENLPEKSTVDIPLLGPTRVSKQVISLQNDRATSYDIYIKVQNELAAAYNELRNEFARQKFGKTYDELISADDSDKISAVRDVYPQRISEAEPKSIGE